MSLKRRSAVVAAISIAVAGAALPATGHAQAAMSKTLSAKSLRIETLCAASVKITSDAAQSGNVSVALTADRADELATVTFRSGSEAVVRNTTPCRDAHPSLVAVFVIPPGMPIAISDGGTLDYDLNTPGSPLAAELSGGGTLAATSLAALNLQLSGNVQMQASDVAARLHIGLSGRARADVDHVEVASTTIDSSGASAVTLGAGSAGELRLRASGSSAIVIGARVNGGSIDASGANRIRLTNASPDVSVSSTGANRVELNRG